MRNSKRTWMRWLAAIVLLSPFTISSGCMQPRHSGVIVIPSHRQIVFAEPNEPVCVPYPAVVLSRGRYLELVEVEALYVAAGRPRP